ncbi:hypothetical protein [Chthonobacter albigriseus]|uniref:hypothetical protein n=1 Tax=Chthonobacter albigriseus TaxID=1683161 RepID=UPI0015EFAB5D|nr:hypothetical protein [Chthonobacter albigriseus]
MARRSALVLIASLLSTSAAGAHEAPSGWTYEAICCSDKDCRPISSGDVEATPYGWRLKLTGDVVAFSQARRSRDGAFHWCTVGGRNNGKTICLYAPEMTQ